MEPFFLRCETCQARLRVRDERFLGQVQSCPKCGSMVHILAPAGWLVTGEAAPTPEPVEVATAGMPNIGAKLWGMMHEHALLASMGAATALVGVGLVTFFALRGGNEVAALPLSTPVVAAPVVEAPVIEPSEVAPIESQPNEEVVVEDDHGKITPATTPARTSPQATVAAVEIPVPATATPSRVASEPAAQPEKPRMLTLEPVREEPKPPTTTTLADAMPDYPPAIEAETGAVIAQPAVEESPARITNLADHLAVPIESIDLPAMPIGEFVNMVSTMTAVPIKLDAKVLGEVGLSTRATVTVRGDNTTAGKLLASVLKEHQLTCVPRDGALIVVKAQQ